MIYFNYINPAKMKHKVRHSSHIDRFWCNFVRTRDWITTKCDFLFVKDNLIPDCYLWGFSEWIFGNSVMFLNFYIMNSISCYHLIFKFQIQILQMYEDKFKSKQDLHLYLTHKGKHICVLPDLFCYRQLLAAHAPVFQSEFSCRQFWKINEEKAEK